MKVRRPRSRPRRLCEHCNTELSHAHYYYHKRHYFKNGVWEKTSKKTRSDSAQSRPLTSSQDQTGESYVPSMCNDLEDNSWMEAIDESEILSDDSTEEVKEEAEEMHPMTDAPDRGEQDNQTNTCTAVDCKEEKPDDQRINLFLDSSESEKGDEDVSCCVDEHVTEEDEEGQRPVSGSPQTDMRNLLSTLSGLSRQIADMKSSIVELTTLVNDRFKSMEDRLAALEGRKHKKNSRRKRRAHSSTISEAVRRLHNSETNTRRYEPEQTLNSRHNEAVTNHLLRVLSASPDLRDADKTTIVCACKTYYETIRRSFRYRQPDLATQAEAARNSARSRSRRKRLFDARQRVLTGAEFDIWRHATVDLMSDEEDGVVDGVSGWIVRPPPFRSPELSKLCATLQSRLEADPKYKATHHTRLHVGQSRTARRSSKSASRHVTEL